MVALATVASPIDSAAATDLPLRMAAAIRLDQPDIVRSVLVEAGTSLDQELGRDETTRLAIGKLSAMLRDAPGEPEELVYAVALMAASLSPTMRTTCRRELTALARAISREELTFLLDSPSPHARIGARLLTGWSHETTFDDEGGAAGLPPSVGAAKAEFGSRGPIGRGESAPVGEEPPPWPAGSEGLLITDSGFDSLFKDLSDSAAPVRRAAIARCSSRTLTRPLAEALIGLAIRDPSPEVRIEALGVFRGQAESLRLFAAERALDSADPAVQLGALALLDFGSAEVTALLARFAVEGVPEAAARATDVIAQLPSSQATALLWSSLPGAAPETQQRIVHRLRELDSSSLSFNVRLALRGPGVDQRIAGLVALGQLEDEPITALIESLSDPSAELRLAALRSLACRSGPDVVDAVGRRLLDPRPDIRSLAIAILRDVQDPHATRWLIGAAADPEDSVRGEACEAIRSMASPEVIDQVLRALASPTTEDVACALLVELGEAATDALMDTIAGAAPRTVELIGDVLRKTEAAPRVTQALRDPNPHRRRRAAEAVAAMGERTAVQTLLGLLDDPEPDVRRRAVELIGGLRDEAACAELARNRAHEPDPRVAEAIDVVLERLGRRTDGRGHWFGSVGAEGRAS